MRVWYLFCANSVSLLVLLAFQVILHDILADEVARARDAVVLAHARLVFIDRLVLQLFSRHWLHVCQHDLVDITGWRRPFELSRLLILFVVRGVSASTLSCSSHFYLTWPCFILVLLP